MENDFDVIYVVDYFADEKKAKKTLNSLISISLAKAYFFFFFGYWHLGCWCWRCKLQNQCLQILLKRDTNEIVLKGNKVWEYEEKYPFPFYEW